MREKFVSKTYLRDVASYQINFINDAELDYYVTVKKIKKAKTPFVISSGLTLIDDGYTIVEITPKTENYNVRVYIDSSGKVLQYYIDVSKQNGFDQSVMMPYYTDLYLDIIITLGEVEVADEDELNAAAKNGEITEADYALAQSVKQTLLKQIESGTNKYLNLNLKKFL